MLKLIFSILALAILVSGEEEIELKEANARFTCTPYGPSSTKPTSVHQLRPGDIDVIAAVGDSLTAANGAKASTILGLITEYRGVCWSMGGENSDVLKSITLPNILRKYNPSLKGFSTGSGGQNSTAAGLNVAAPGHTSYNMLDQAGILIARMKTFPGVNFNNDWKLITFFIGGNDLCDTCTNPDKFSTANYIKNIQNTLDYFMANFPRTVVNLVMTLDVSGIVQLNGLTCRVMQNMFCDCGLNYINGTKQLAREYQAATEQLIASGRYDTKSDFTVILHKFMKDMDPPLKPDGTGDLSYFAPDCFHFSEKGHQTSAIELWNSMITRNQDKPTTWNIGVGIKCPDPNTSPYIFTNVNSRSTLNKLFEQN